MSRYLAHLRHGSSGSRPTPCWDTQTLLPAAKMVLATRVTKKIISCSVSCSKWTWCWTTFLNNIKYLLQILHSLTLYQTSWDYSETILRLVYLKCTEYIFIFIHPSKCLNYFFKHCLHFRSYCSLFKYYCSLFQKHCTLSEHYCSLFGSFSPRYQTRTMHLRTVLTHNHIIPL